MFWKVVLLIPKREYLKSPIIIQDLSISSFSFTNFCFSIYVVCWFVSIHLEFLCLLDELIILSWHNIPLVINNTRVSRRVSKRQRNQRSNCQHSWDHGKAKEFQKSIYFCFIYYTKNFVCITTNWKILNDENTSPPYLFPEKPVCRSKSNS